MVHFGTLLRPRCRPMPPNARTVPAARVPRIVSAACLGAASAAGCAAGPDVATLYGAFGNEARVYVEGRVVEPGSGDASLVGDSARRNAFRTAGLFMQDDCERCEVDLELPGGAPVTLTTDDEGYFRAEIARGSPAQDGWVPISVDGASLPGDEALVVPPGNVLGIISDIDDTVLVTEVGSTYLMLRNTFLRNPLQREAVPGMVALYARTLAANPRPEAAPLFFVSSSPDALHGYLEDFLDASGFARSVLVTRRLSLEGDGDPLDPVLYKSGRIAQILERLPDVRFVLVGDDGESDPEIYAAIRERYPERIADVWIRRVASAADPAGAVALPAGEKDLAAVLKAGADGGDGSRETGGVRP